MATGVGAQQTGVVRDAMAQVIRFARNKAREFMQSADARRDETVANLAFILVFVVLFARRGILGLFRGARSSKSAA